MNTFYDHSEDWVTHLSMQRVDYYKTAELTGEWKDRWKKPVVIDECAYEGNIDHSWGNITGEEMTRRFWEGTVRGGYMGHGETYECPEDILWWSHGGVLKGSSPKRIAFMRQLLEEYPQYEISLVSDFGDAVCGGCGKDCFLYYYSFFQPSRGHYYLPVSGEYQAEIIDTWNMTRQVLPGNYTGKISFALPGRPYILVRFIKTGERDLSHRKITPDTSFWELEELENGKQLLETLKERLGDSFESLMKIAADMPLKSLAGRGMTQQELMEMLRF